jgi:acetyl esterase
MAAGGLDPEVTALMARMGSDLADAPADPTVEQRRELMTWMCHAYGPAMMRVKAAQDRWISTPAGPLRLRIYWPRRFSLKPPGVVLNIHGGGWVLGGPDSYERVCRAYCARGDAIVVDVDYRRAPEHRFPAAIDDCEAALAWVADNARSLGGDPKRLTITGDSAGGALAAVACQRARVAVHRLVLLYPVMTAAPDAQFPSRTDLGDGRYFLREFDIRRAETEYLDRPSQGEDPHVSPLLIDDASLRGHPPTLVVTAEFDPLRDEGRAYADRLRAVGVKADYVCLPGTIHGCVIFAGVLKRGQAGLDLIARTFRS